MRRRPFRRHPIIGLMLSHFGIGGVAGIGLLGGLVASDCHGLGTALMSDASPAVAGTAAALLFGAGFGTLAASAGVMLLPADSDDGGRGRHRLAGPEAQLARIPIKR